MTTVLLITAMALAFPVGIALAALVLFVTSARADEIMRKITGGDDDA